MALLAPAAAQVAPPTACFSVTPSSPLTNETTRLDSSCSTDDNRIEARGWDLDNDGQFDDGSSVVVTKTWSQPGTYTVRLGVIDPADNYDIETKTITVRNRAPIAAFTVSPASASLSTGQEFKFDSKDSSDPDGSIVSREWDLDGDATPDFGNDGSGVTAKKSFATAGTYTIRLRVTDNKGATHVATRDVTVGNRPPVASFTMGPAPLLSKKPIVLTSTSTDPDGRISRYEWDLDGDGFDDGTTSSVTNTWDTPGDRSVRLRVTDNDGGQAIATNTVPVGNRPPLASFTVSPATVVEGDTVTLTSTASDDDGTVRQQAWDLDNDGAYDDATGPTAKFTAGPAGAYSVGLRVVDDSNTARTATQTITVGQRPAGSLPEPRTDSGQQQFDVSTPTTPTPTVPPVTNPVTPLRFLDPFPVVRMRGRTTGRGAKLTAFTVRAPHGSVARLECKGRGCPVKKQQKTIKTRTKRGSATIHFTQVERFLPAGIELQVFVTQDGMVGKYTRIRIRRLALPIRSDRCLLSASAKPSACPASP